jgi:hypothetical protein
MIGIFIIQILPQNSYLQGKAEYLYCAVENTAFYKYAEVIICGGGSVSAEALETEISRPQQKYVSNI